MQLDTREATLVEKASVDTAADTVVDMAVDSEAMEVMKAAMVEDMDVNIGDDDLFFKKSFHISKI